MKHAVLFALVVCVQSVKLPPNFQKCNRKQPDLKECVLKAAQHGVPQLTRPFKNLNLPSLDPFIVPAITIKAGSGKVAINQDLKDCNHHGFNKMQLDQFEFDFEKKSLRVKGMFPKITITCQYELDGKVLLLPIKGKGGSTVVLDNLQVVNLLGYEEVRKNDKTYARFVKSDLDMSPGLIHFNFDNLFNGDKALGDSINKVMNENWKEVFEDVKSDYTETVNRILLSLLNGFFSKVSIEEAFD
ncbi:hypothetical protein MTP99_006258 [Tenebrio molitor]|nr:hypothetical protein MTP99_006258 [Tenebrio molitor]